MALINKIREKSGLAVGVIAVGLTLFLVGGDILGPNSLILGTGGNDVGEIAGKTINIQDYQAKVEELKYQFTMNQGRNPSNDDMNMIQDQAWEALIADIAYGRELEKLGIYVSEAEIVDMVQGKNISPEIRQAFTDPESGEFNQEMILNYLRNLDQMPPEQQNMWYSFEASLRPNRERRKFESMMVNTTFITKAEAKKEYESQNNIAEIRYLFVPYYTIADSLVSASDEEMKAYMKKNPSEYKLEESRGIKYVAIDIKPSQQDSLEFFEEVAAIRKELEESNRAKDDSIIARFNTEGSNPFRTYTPENLPQFLKDHTSLEEGQILEAPLNNSGMFRMYKLSAIGEGDEPFARARHILFRAEGEDENAKNEARRKANDVLRQIQNGADFALMAGEHGTDGTASRGGDLGWFSEGRMVAPFEKAVFEASRPGLIPRLIETDFGFHIIDVQETKTNRTYKVATVTKEFLASDASRDRIFRKADLFASASKNEESFTKEAEEAGFQVRLAMTLKKNDRRVNNLRNAREVVRWLYNDAKVDKVSDVFELEDTYVVAVMVKKTDEGLADFEAVKSDLEKKVKAQKKFEIIAERIKDAGSSLDEMADAFGDDASLNSNSDIRMNSNNLPSIGRVPEAIGKAFALNEGERTEPFQTEEGVLVVQLEQLTPAASVEDFSVYRNQAKQQRQSKASFDLSEAIKDFAQIQDKRYRFY